MLGRRRFTTILGGVLILGWSFAVGAGLQRIWDYNGTAGSAAATPARWPADSGIHTDPALPALIMFLHPQCSCSRASLAELREVLEKNPGRFSATVLFHQPPGLPPAWTRTDTWKTARSLPGAHVAVDDGGLEAQRFGAATSGHLVLYGRDGSLLFSGGITGSRGHVGDNTHLRQLLNAVNTGSTADTLAPVFGCGLESR
jgi:hypothetical protein